MSIVKIDDVLKVDGKFKVISSETSPPNNTPTYSLSRSPSATDEGTTVTYTLNTTNVAQGTLVAYTVTGISQEDLSNGNLTGNFTVDSMGSASVSFTIANDEWSEGTETMSLSAGGQSLGVVINDTSTDSSYYLPETVFNGTSDYITVPASSELTLGAGDFTIQFWCKFTDTSLVSGKNRTIFSQNNNSTCTKVSNRLKIDISTNGYCSLWNNTTLAYVGIRNSGAGAMSPINDGVWRHVAFVKHGTSVRGFLNGRITFTQNYSNLNFNDSVSPYYIGSCTNTQGFYKGSLSDFRITRGTALYTGAFTSWTTELFTPPARTGA